VVHDLISRAVSPALGALLTLFEGAARLNRERRRCMGRPWQ
jgi:hypothetical protein